MAMLEHSYLEHGIEYEILDKTDKVLFSPQAYAIAAVNECQSNPNVCKEYGKGAYANTTQGGDIAWVCFPFSVIICVISISSSLSPVAFFSSFLFFFFLPFPLALLSQEPLVSYLP